MLGYNLSIWDFCSFPEKVSQRLTVSVWEISAYHVEIIGVYRCCCITKFNPDSSSLYNDKCLINSVITPTLLRTKLWTKLLIFHITHIPFIFETIVEKSVKKKKNPFICFTKSRRNILNVPRPNNKNIILIKTPLLCPIIKQQFAGEKEKKKEEAFDQKFQGHLNYMSKSRKTIAMIFARQSNNQTNMNQKRVAVNNNRSNQKPNPLFCTIADPGNNRIPDFFEHIESDPEWIKQQSQLTQQYLISVGKRGRESREGPGDKEEFQVRSEIGIFGGQRVLWECRSLNPSTISCALCLRRRRCCWLLLWTTTTVSGLGFKPSRERLYSGERKGMGDTTNQRAAGLVFRLLSLVIYETAMDSSRDDGFALLL